jgi:hypothetical protein
MEICRFCRDAIVRDPPPLDADIDLVYVKGDRQRHHRSLGKLRASSSFCVVCQSILKGLKSTQEPGLSLSNQEPFDLHVRTNSSQPVKRGELLRDNIVAKAVQRGESQYFLSMAIHKGMSSGELLELCRWRTICSC